MRKNILISSLTFMLMFSSPVESVRQKEKQNSTILFMGDNNYPPLEYIQDGKPTGFVIDLLNEIAKTMNLNIRIDLAPWHLVRSNLEQGKIDGITSMYYSKKRDKLIDFSDPHIFVTYSVIVRSESKIRDFSDTPGKAVILHKSDSIHDMFKKSSHPGKIIATDKIIDALTKLSNGISDYAVLPRMQSIYLINKHSINNLKIVGKPIYPQKNCFAVQEGNHALQTALNEGLRLLHASGKYDEIYDKWFAVYGKPDYRKHLKYTLGVIGTIAVLFIITLAWTWSLRKKVAQKTAELEKDQREKERIQNQLIQSQKMEMIGTLAGGLAHDFNNVLSGITGTTSLLNYMIESESLNTDQLKEYIELIDMSADRATQIVDRLLTISRKYEPSPGFADINTILKNTSDICRNTFDKSITFETAFYEEPAIAHIDSRQIEQILLNIMVNSSHAMTLMQPDENKRSGVLYLSVNKIHIIENTPSEDKPDIPGYYWKISISDTGVGMAPEILDQIFNPFFTTKKKGSGTGLGLSMVHDIISKHNGYINVESTPGTGTIFKIFLPIPHEIPEFSADKKSEIIRGTGSILIIDDEEDILTVTGGMLQICGYKCIKESSPVKGIDIYKKKQKNIKAVLLDIAMPKMSGDEVFSALKEINPGVRVLITSGMKNDYRVQNAMEYGALDFLQKPYVLSTLSQKIDKVIKAEVS